MKIAHTLRYNSLKILFNTIFNDPSMVKTKGQESKANVFKNSGGENS